MGGIEHVGRNQHREHAERLVGLDEPHAPHIGRQVVDDVHAHGRAAAVVLFQQVGGTVLYIIEALIPVFERDPVHGTNVLHSVLTQPGDQVPADEPARSGHHYPAHAIPPRISFAVERPWRPIHTVGST